MLIFLIFGECNNNIFILNVLWNENFSDIVFFC